MFAKGSAKREMHADFYRLHEKFDDVAPDNDDAWWDDLIRSAEAFALKYKTDDGMSGKIAAALVEYAEYVNRQRLKDGQKRTEAERTS